MQLRSFSSIKQYRHVVETVELRSAFVGKDAADEPMYDHARPRPVLRFRGTVKLHGSNVGTRFELYGPDAGTYTQSRERFLLPDSIQKGADNFGFAAWVHGQGAKDIEQLRSIVLSAKNNLGLSYITNVHVFGEYCGPSVNGKAAIGRLPDRWVVLRAIATDVAGNEHRLPVDQLSTLWAARQPGAAVDSRINFITDFPGFALDIDFSNPEEALDALEQLTLDVEKSCPVASALGHDGLGEGIVWECVTPGWEDLIFKTKGVKHKGTKNARIVQIKPEVMASRQAFVDAVLTESRLEQGLDLLRARLGVVCREHIGEFLKWIGTDIHKEEADTLAASGMTHKDVIGMINRQAREWALPRLSQA